METILRSRNFIIKDKNILTIINNTNVNYLQLTFDRDYDSELIVSAKMIKSDLMKNIPKYCTQARMGCLWGRDVQIRS